MISNITYIPRHPLVTKAKQIYANSDRRQRQQEINNNNESAKVDDQISSVSNIDLYGYGYEMIEQQSSILDIRI